MGRVASQSHFTNQLQRDWFKNQMRIITGYSCVDLVSPAHMVYTIGVKSNCPLSTKTKPKILKAARQIGYVMSGVLPLTN